MTPLFFHSELSPINQPLNTQYGLRHVLNNYQECGRSLVLFQFMSLSSSSAQIKTNIEILPAQ